MSHEFPELPPLTSPNVWRVVGGTILVVLITIGFWLLVMYHQIVLVIFLAIILSTAFRPLIGWLNRRGVPRATGVVVTYGTLVLVVALMAFYAVPLLINQGQVLQESAESLYSDLHAELIESENPILRRMGNSLPQTSSELIIDSESTAVVDPETADEEVNPNGWYYVTLITEGFIYTGIVLALSFYWSLESERILRTLFLLFPLDKRQGVRSVVATIEQKVGQYIIGQAILCLIIGGLSFALYLSIGLPYAFLLAIVAGLFEAVPNIGPLLGAVPALLVAITGNPADAIWVLVGTAVIQLVENNFLVPRVMSQALGVRPFVTLMAILIFGALFGLIGAIVAIPLAVIVELFLHRALQNFELNQGVTEGRSQTSVLRYEAQEIVRDVRQQIREKASVAAATSDQVEDSIEAIAVDLDSLLAARKEEPEVSL